MWHPQLPAVPIARSKSSVIDSRGKGEERCVDPRILLKHEHRVIGRSGFQASPHVGRCPESPASAPLQAQKTIRFILQVLELGAERLFLTHFSDPCGNLFQPDKLGGTKTSFSCDDWSHAMMPSTEKSNDAEHGASAPASQDIIFTKHCEHVTEAE